MSMLQVITAPVTLAARLVVWLFWLLLVSWWDHEVPR